MRRRGVDRVSVAQVMAEAGLTHGGFYAHFATKADLAAAAFGAAGREGRALWFRDLAPADATAKLRQIVGRYLHRGHRDRPEAGCAFAALAADATREPGALKPAFERELRLSVAALAAELGPEDPKAEERALGILAVCVGGLILARAVKDATLSERILSAARRLAVGGRKP